MKFVLFRHAHKGIQPFDDPELSLPGFEQAAKILALADNKTLPRPTALLVSPRRRTSQTFYPISKNSTLPMHITEALDQCLPGEGSREFRLRVQNFLRQLSTLYAHDDVVFACTHYDWIECAMQLIQCDKDLTTFEFAHWSPTQYIVFEINSFTWTYLQKGTAK